MGFEGSLDTVSFGDILNTLCHISQEGVLVVHDDKQKKVIHFRDNGITLVGGSERVRIRLGEMLVQAGKIEAWELENALGEQEQTGKLLGEVLVDQGLVTEEEIEELTSDQIEQEICDVFFWEDAYFSFREGPPQENFAAEENQITLRFDVQSLLVRIADHLGEWEEIRKQIPSYSRVFVVTSEDIELTLPEGETEENFQKVLEKLDGTYDVNDIIRLTRFSTFCVCRILSTLLSENVIRPANFDELLLISEQYHQKGQPQRQLHFLKMALELRPTDEDILSKIASTYETLGGKEAGIYYCRLGEISSDASIAIRYFERSISYLPKSIEPREKLLELSEFIENEKRQLYHARMLADLYLKDEDYEKAHALCSSYLDSFPQDLDLRRILVNIYLKQGMTDKAIKEHETIASFFSTSGNIKLCVEQLQEILNLDSGREDIRKQLKYLQRKARWAGKQHWLIAGIVASILLISVVAYVGYYEYSARRIYRHAQEIMKFNHEEARHEYKIIVENYGMSTVAANAKDELKKIAKLKKKNERHQTKKIEAQERKILKKLRQIEKIAERGEIRKARVMLVGYQKKYRNKNWQPFFEKIEQRLAELEQARRAEVLAQKWKLATDYTQREDWEQAVAIYMELREVAEYRDKASQELKNIINLKSKKMLQLVHNLINKAYSYERNKNLVECTDVYNKVRRKVAEFTRFKELPQEVSKKLQEYRRLADIALNRLAGYEKQVQQRLFQARKLEKQAKFAEAFAEVCKVWDHPTLRNTRTAQQAHLRFRVESQPPKAIIQGTEQQTPCMVPVRLGQDKDIVLEHRGFKPLKVNLSRQKSPVIRVVLKKTVHWSYNTQGPIWGRTNIYHNTVLVTSRSGKLLALNPRGELLWQYQSPSRFGDILGGASVFDKLVYVGSNDSKLAALHFDTGRLKWRFSANDFIQMTPSVEDESIYFGTAKGYIYALARKNGKKQWIKKASSGIIATILWSKLVLCTTKNGDLLALDLLDGKTRWRKRISGGAISKPIIAATSIFFGNANGKFFCLNMETGNPVWMPQQLRGWITGAINVSGSHVYVGTKSGFFYKISRIDGVIEWKAQFPKAIHSAPVITNNLVYVGCMDGFLYACDIQSGDIAWKEKYCEKGIYSDLVADKNNIYIGTIEGLLYALDI